jgi:hypothetical protein
MSNNNSPKVFFNCPHCGNQVPAAAKVCRSCGASDDCGWNEDESYDGDYDSHADEDDFDYDRFVAREFPDQAEGHLHSDHKPWVKAVILVIILSFVLTLLSF